MELEIWASVLAGAVGAVVMMATRSVLRLAVPLRMDVTRIWGTLFGFHGRAGRVVGIVVHVIVSSAVAVLYAVAFDVLGARDGLWAWGLLGGVVHWVLAGLMMSVLPTAHPELPEEREAPGAFTRNFGTGDVVGFLVGHLAFGVIVGIVYAWSATGVDKSF